MEKERKENFLKLYDHVFSIFKKEFGYELFFIGGNLLGVIREGDLLENDKDMDLSYFSKYTEVEDVSAEFLDIVYKLQEIGQDVSLYQWDKITGNPRINFFKWFYLKEHTDIMPYWKFQGKLYRRTFVGYEGEVDIILPLKDYNLHGTNIKIPNKPEIKLENVYGKDWRTPKEDFDKSKRMNAETKRMLHICNYHPDILDKIKK